jgi:hypothetical protein
VFDFEKLLRIFGLLALIHKTAAPQIRHTFGLGFLETHGRSIKISNGK